MKRWLPLTVRLAALAIVFSGWTARGGEETVWMAEQDDGQIVGPVDIAWSAEERLPMVAGKSLADAESQIRVLQPVRTSLALRGSVRLPNFYLEMIDGDRLPVRELSVAPADRLPGRFGALELWVVPDLLSTRLAGAEQRPVRVRTRWLRRLVQGEGEKSAEPGLPGTLRTSDGRVISFRTVRFEPGQVVALGEQGIVRAPLATVVELNLPTLDPWQAYCEQLVLLAPDLSVPLLRIHTPEGLTATLSPRGIRPQLAGEDAANQAGDGALAVQPAWALDPLTVVPTNVTCWERHRATEVPLDRLIPTSRQAGSILPAGRRPQRGSSVVGWPLVAGGAERRLGYGVAARSELSFPLPDSAVGFRTLVGLDRAAGDGGCAIGLVHGNAISEKPLYRSDFLIGSKTLVDTGLLPLNGARRLLLVADPAHAPRPAGADPLDIRDLLDWISPTVILDPARLLSAIQQSAPGGLPGWEDWSLPAEDLAQLQVEQGWQGAPAAAPSAEEQPPALVDRPLPAARFVAEVAPRDPFLALTRSIAVGREDRWLLVRVSGRSLSGGEAPHAQVRFRGAAVAEFSLPVADENHPAEPVALPWERFQGEQGELEILLFSLSERSRLQFGSVELTETLPTEPPPVE